MAIAFRAYSSNFGGTTGVFTKPTGTVSGDVIVAQVSQAANVAPAITFTPPSGWVQIGTTIEHIGVVNSGIASAVYYKVCGGSEPSTYTFTSTNGAPIAIYGAAYSGVDNVTPLDTSSQNEGTNATASGTAITTASTNEMLVWIAYTAQNAFSVALSGWNARAAGTGASNTLGGGITGFYDLVQAAAASTGAVTNAISAADDWTVFLVALSPASPADNPPTARLHQPGDTPPEDLRSAVIRTVLPSGAAPYPEHVGAAIIDFGAPPGSQTALIYITQSTIGAGDPTEAFLMGDTTPDHNADEHLMVPIDLVTSPGDAAAGFLVKGISDSQLQGKFRIRYVW